MIVRDPFERLVSAYRDKLENLNIGKKHGVEFFYRKYGKKIVQKYRKKPLNDTEIYGDYESNLPKRQGVEPTFQEFVKYLIDTDLTHYADDHWMPYYLYCTPCFIDFDVIAKFETIERDQKFLINKLKMRDQFQPKWKHLTKGRQTSEVVKKYMATISKSDVQKLIEKYQVDFEMFGYSYEKYLSN